MSFARGRTYAGVTAFVVTGLILATLLHLPTTTFAGQPAKEDAKQAIASVLASALQVSAGPSYTCALTTSGGVKCWGLNSYGQLGDGTRIDKNMPVDVIGLINGVRAINAGRYHACAVLMNGGVKCWGSNLYGELGDGTTVGKTTPVDVIGLTSGVSMVSAGYSHTCALTTSSGVKCWGSNHDGELGDGTTESKTTPVDVFGLTKEIIAVSAGHSYTCAITASNKAKCWGSNNGGQLGDGTTVTKVIPTDVIDLTSGVSAIDTGYSHTCAITTNGEIKCWGNNFFGQLGDGTTTSRTTPVNIIGLTSSVNSVSVGYSYTCATTASGVKCWGLNDVGELGDGTWANKTIPVDVVGLAGGASTVSAGQNHTCAVTLSSGVKCWGNNRYGELGDGIPINKTTPVDVVGLTSGVKMLSTGDAHTCIVTIGGGVKCWGRNRYGGLGDDTTMNKATPVDVVGLTSGVISVSAGYQHSCAVTSGGGAKCWGSNYYGQLGDGTTTNKSIPVDVIGLTSASSRYNFWVKSLQLDPRILSAKVPVDATLFGIRFVGPGSDL